MTNVMETLVFICLAKNCHHPPSRLMAILPIELRPTSMAMPSAALQQRKVQRQPRNAGRKADDQIATAPAHGAQGRLSIKSADRVDDNVEALRSACGFERGAEVSLAFFVHFGRIGDGNIRAGPGSGLALGCAACRRHHLCAERLCDLATGLADAAAGAEHEDFVCGFYVAAFNQRMPDRAVDERKN